MVEPKCQVSDEASRVSPPVLTNILGLTVQDMSWHCSLVVKVQDMSWHCSFVVTVQDMSWHCSSLEKVQDRSWQLVFVVTVLDMCWCSSEPWADSCCNDSSLVMMSVVVDVSSHSMICTLDFGNKGMRAVRVVLYIAECLGE
jgi:hypothetical protein